MRDDTDNELVVIVPERAVRPNKANPDSGLYEAYAIDPHLAVKGCLTFGVNSWRGDNYFSIVVEAARKQLWDPDEVLTISLDATEPPDLLNRPTPDDVWVRVSRTGPSGFPEVELRGPRHALEQFIRDNWGDEMLDEMDGDISKYAVL